jgi:hypothetical protein
MKIGIVGHSTLGGSARIAFDLAFGLAHSGDHEVSL